MATPPVTEAQAREALDAFKAAGGNKREAARRLKLPHSTYENRLAAASRLYHIGDDSLHKTERLTLRCQALERELHDLRNEHRKLQEDHWTVERVKQLIHDGKTWVVAPPKWLTGKVGKSRLTGVPCLLASDWHADEVVEPNEINGVNAFNRQILDARVKLLFQKTVELCLHHMADPKYDYAVLMLGGDLVSGNIHEELRQSNAAPITKTMLHVLELLTAGIDTLLEAFGKVLVPCVVGNHGRIDMKPRYKLRAFESYEWLIYQMLAKHYAGDDRVRMEIADGPDYHFSVYATRYLLTHGDQFKGGSGISGALAPLMLGEHRKRKRAMATRQDFDVMVMGHWHQYIHLRGLIVNSALKGYDEYAFAHNFEFELPCQALWITHPEYGITARWPVLLEKPGTTF